MRPNNPRTRPSNRPLRRVRLVQARGILTALRLNCRRLGTVTAQEISVPQKILMAAATRP